MIVRVKLSLYINTDNIDNIEWEVDNVIWEAFDDKTKLNLIQIDTTEIIEVAEKY